MGVAAQRKVRGVKRGQETILGVLSPFALRRWAPASPPGDPGNPSAVGTAFSPPPDGGSPRRRRRQFLAGEHRRPRAAEGGNHQFTPAWKSVIMKQTAPLTEVYAMPKAKWNLNTIYISERLQESLRPISRCALTTVVAPMGYGKTTAVEWYPRRTRPRRGDFRHPHQRLFRQPRHLLAERAGRLCPRRVRPAARLRLPVRRRGRRPAHRGSVPRAGRRTRLLYLPRRFPPADQTGAPPGSSVRSPARLPANVHLILASRDRFPVRRRHRPAGREGLPDRRRAAPPQPYRARRLHSAAAAPSFPTSRSSPCCITARAGSPPSI